VARVDQRFRRQTDEQTNEQRNIHRVKTPLLRRELNPLIATLKPQSDVPSYSNTVIGTLAVDGWAASFGTGCTARRLYWAKPQPTQAPPRCTKCNNAPINGQCTNFVLFDVTVTLWLPLESETLIIRRWIRTFRVCLHIRCAELHRALAKAIVADAGKGAWTVIHCGSETM